MTQQSSSQAIMATLRQTPAADIPNLPFVEEKFTALLGHIQRVPKDVAQSMFHAEKFHFLKRINESADLRACEPLSLYGVFVDIAVNGLSLDPTKKLVYIIPGSVNIGSKDSPVWVKRASLEISPQGELSIRQRDGQLKYADNVVIVYEGDTFEPGIGQDGKKYVNYKLNASHTTTIMGAFIRIVRLDGSVDFQWLLREDIARLKGYSERKNKGHANALYSSNNGQIDTGFLAAKMIKHAFKTYPKARVAGSFAALATDKVEEIIPEDIYGFSPASALPEPPLTLPEPTMMVTAAEPTHQAKMARAAMEAEPVNNGSVKAHYDSANDGGF